MRRERERKNPVNDAVNATADFLEGAARRVPSGNPGHIFLNGHRDAIWKPASEIAGWLAKKTGGRTRGSK